ncbi:hypothetical protein SELMODRAFT_422787 [Selaginella moellendorffii]|uniref:J domain-containing protein n=1 Tax=Selaginella moellendorffii TaxID=88036 RepID=D8SJJ2_SELML|nr:hypothetical protein SELMODRAFT_422787 [Selaginella moellendorffii]
MAQTSLPGIRSSRLQDAIQLYCQALSLSPSDSDRAMCCKNLGQAFWARSKHRLAMVEEKNPRQQQQQEAFLESLCFDLLSSVSYFLEALNFSRPPAQPKEWVQGIHWTLVDVAWTVDDIRESSPMGGRYKGRFLAELCAVFQQKVPTNVKLQASAIVHKSCAQHGLKNAMALDARFARVPVLRDCLFHLSIAQAHTDPSAAAFLAEIAALRASIVKQIDACEELRRNSPSSSPKTGEFRHEGAAASRPNPAELRRNQSYSEERSQSAQSRIGGNLNPPRGCSSFRSSPPKNRGGGRQPSDLAARSGPSDVERLFNSLPPLDFLRCLYDRYPPSRRRGESLSNLGDIRDVGELKSAYRRAISHYHPDHCGSCPNTAKHADEITKYLIINFNALKDLYYVG